MNKIAIITDSNSGITQKQGRDMGISVIPMPFFINGELYLEDITITQDEFYKKLDENEDISTSQPTLGDLMELWEGLLQSHDEIVYIPMSSALSGSWQTASNLAPAYGGRVEVVNNLRISVTQQQSVLDAVRLSQEGKTAAEIRAILEDEKLQASIYITVDNLNYLKRGGRATSAAAALGTALNVKPVLQIQGGKLDIFSRARGWKAAKKMMLKAAEADMKTRFSGFKDKMTIGVSYSKDRKEAEDWIEEVRKKFPDNEIFDAPLSLSVSCHTGPGALAVTCIKRV